jgi:hypothetical protein
MTTSIVTHFGMSLGAIAVLAILLPSSAMAEAPQAPTCLRRLVVELTPDVPDPRDDAFLSSLLSNEVEYRLTFRGESAHSDIFLELTGPGPAYRCEEVIRSMRKDGRVVSIRGVSSEGL